MKYNKLGRSNLDISTIGMGCWAIGGKKWGPTDDDTSIKAILKAVDVGINFFDTADFYGLGHSEKLLGQALSGNQDAIIATKVGLSWSNKGKVKHDLSTNYIKKAVDASLKRLNRDYIDLYQIHWPDPMTPIFETLETLGELVAAGKIRYVGASNLDFTILKEVAECPWLVSYQAKYNLFNKGSSVYLIPFCKKNNLAFIGYEPLAKGMLTGKFGDNPQFDLGDHRKYEPHFTIMYEDYKKKIDVLAAVAKKHNMSLAQMSLGLMLLEDGVTCLIPGAKTAKQVEENAGAADIDEVSLKLVEAEIKQAVNL